MQRHSPPASEFKLCTCSKVSGSITRLVTCQRWGHQQGHHMHHGLPRKDMCEKAKPHLQCFEGQHSAQKCSTCLSLRPYSLPLILPSALFCSCCAAFALGFAASCPTFCTLCFAALSCLNCDRLCLVLSLLRPLIPCDCLYTITRTASVLCLWV